MKFTFVAIVLAALGGIAHGQIYDLACPDGTTVLEKTSVPATSHFRAYICVDAFGVVTSPVFVVSPVTPVPPNTPDAVRYAKWEANVVGTGAPTNFGNPDAWLLTSDIMRSADGGERDIYLPPDAAAGIQHKVSGTGFQGWRLYVGAPYAYTQRKTICRGIAKVDTVAGVGYNPPYLTYPLVNGLNYYVGMSDLLAEETFLASPMNAMVLGVEKPAGNRNPYVPVPWPDWFLICSDRVSGLTEYTDTHITVVPGTRYKFELTLDGTTVFLSINGLASATCTAHVPHGVLGNFWFLQPFTFTYDENGGTLTGSASNGYLEYLYSENLTP